MSALEQVDLVSAAAATDVPADPWPGRFIVARQGSTTYVHDLHAAEISEHRSDREAYVHIGGMVQRERDLMAADFERGGKPAMDEGHEHRMNRVLARRRMGQPKSYADARARVFGASS